ncbi:hypothetical protein METBIDRAFT_64492 [Metschnikowia bicuspidata var. bicuspidata NRRL YB-4993]|uniref:PH-domain-containing protein n=1 Tax=Metschnikowia bicuspidata var. bicuspidata NRRL YB-4993 TaxID=869754 RepID=A0A1A0HHC7_9ASCO|nr:hypothetical protein METBIDRAFT_64492 [Metschnikowia bicuspidata var. bicuspidata NRRL YB-4993]OBA23584.1 hypothetical protein METBIDRAFT_64492 [Metschnikowia bicuspidata var. bicuspidata NRRL YB-4993]
MDQPQESIYVCIKQFKARLGDELSLRVGDRIEILADDSEYNDGWYMGRNAESKAVGLFPKSFTKAEVPLDPSQPSLLRSRSRRVLTGSSAASAYSASKVPSVPAPTEPPNDKQDTISELDKALQELLTSSLDPLLYHKKGSPVSHVRTASNLSMTQDLNPLKVSSWTPKQVSSYFAIVLGFDMSIAGKFARHKITGQILLQLDLAHLKELEIISFGTRFDIFKEIEKLKEISSRVNSLSHKLASGELQESHVSTRHIDDAVKSHQRTRSHSLDNLTFDEVLHSPNTTTFLTPRKAPRPPSQSPMDSSFKFGGSPTLPHHSRTMSPRPPSVREKTSSLGLLRPASSIYDIPVSGHHRKTSSGLGAHKRASSVFLFLSNNMDAPVIDSEKFQNQKRASKFFQDGDLTIIGDELDIEDGSISPKKTKAGPVDDLIHLKPENPQSKLKSLRSVSTQNFRNLTVLKKLKTSAFTEGIREISPDEAIKSANFSGWMAKKSRSSLGWRSRYFTLHGTRLSYYTSLRDRKEKGLIDITAHKVLPISTEGESTNPNDKYIALYASLTGFGRYCFKLVPPAPGFKKGLTFTQPKTHYFAVETQDEMRGWLKALMTATIDIDDSVPVVSSCNTPTVTLAKAQELLTRAREETKLMDEELRAGAFERLNETGADTTPSFSQNDSVSSGEPSPVIGSMDETTLSSSTTAMASKQKQPKLTLDTQVKNTRAPSTPQPSVGSGGFASPYLLASGMLSPKPNESSPKFQRASSGTSTPQASVTERSISYGSTEGLGTPRGSAGGARAKDVESITTAGSSLSKTMEEKKKTASDKFVAYSSDGSFPIKSKKK